MRKAYEANQASLVEVQGPRSRGPGVVIGGNGQILTSVRYVSLERAKVHHGELTDDAQVVVANARLGIAIVAITNFSMPPAAVRLGEVPPEGTWLVAERRLGRKTNPVLVQVLKARAAKGPFFEVNEPLKPGTALFDANGRLLGMTTRTLRGRARAIPLDAVKQELAASSPP